MSDEKILKLSYRWPSHFGILFDRHQKRFLAIAKKNLRSKDDAEDVVQETFVRIYKYGEKFPENGGKFIPWSNTILRNCIADQINKYKKASIPLSEEVENSTPDLDQPKTGVEEEHVGRVRFVLNKIGGKTAEIINLRYVLGKSFKEIGKILKIKSGAARVRFHRSKKIFMETYKQFNNL